MVAVQGLERLTPVRVHDLQNANSESGRAITELKNLGLWTTKAVEPDGRGYRVWIIGPATKA